MDSFGREVCWLRLRGGRQGRTAPPEISPLCCLSRRGGSGVLPTWEKKAGMLSGSSQLAKQGEVTRGGEGSWTDVGVLALCV